MAKRNTGSVYQQGKGDKKRPNYMIKFYRDGVMHRESTGTADRAEAEKTLRDRLTALDKGIPVVAAVGKVRWEQAVADLIQQFETNERVSLQDTKTKLAMHLSPVFKGRKLATITVREIEAYKAKRRGEQYIPGSRATADGRVIIGKGKAASYSNGQINRELATLKQLFRLQRELGSIAIVPKIAMLKDSPPRSGFFSPEELQAVCDHLRPEHAAIVRMAYVTGWRVKDEIIPLEWDRVDFDHGEIRLHRSKNGEGRSFPMTDDLRALLLERAAARDAAVAAGHTVPWVFFRVESQAARGGKRVAVRVRVIRHAWVKACRAAGVKRVPHDFRRTAARNMVRLSVPERVAQSLVGHKTRAMFDRYNITSAADARLAIQQLSGQLATEPVPALASLPATDRRRTLIEQLATEWPAAAVALAALLPAGDGASA